MPIPSVPANTAPRAESSGSLGRAHLQAGDIGHELHQEAVAHRAAIGVDRFQLQPGFAFHQLEHIIHNIRDRFQRGPHHMGAGGGRGQAQNPGPGIRPPIRRAQPHKSRHQVNPGRIAHRQRQAFGFFRRLDQLQLVAQPLDGGAGKIDDAFEGIGRLVIKNPADRRDDAALGNARFGSNIQQDRRTGAKGDLGAARLKSSARKTRPPANRPSRRRSAEEPAAARRNRSRQNGHRWGALPAGPPPAHQTARASSASQPRR